jgi:hypothetical protein
LDSSFNDGDHDNDYDDDDTNTHALHQHFCSKCGGCKFPFSFDGDEEDGDSSDDEDDDEDDDDDDDLSKVTLSSLASSGDSSSSARSTVHGNDPNSCTSNPFQPSSNRNAFGRSDDTDVMLSRTNNCLQQHIFSSDSSSLIGLDCNLEYTRAKANSYKVSNDSSEVGNDCFSCRSDESASVDAGDPSIPMPNSFKPSPRSSFEVSNVPLSKGHAMTTGPVVNLHLGSPERGDVSRRGSTPKCIGTRSSTMAVKALRLLQPAKGENEGY